MFALLGVLLSAMAGTLQRQARLKVGEGTDTAKPIEQLGGFLEYREFLQSIDLASAAASTGANQDMTVTGLAVGDIPVFVDAAEGLTVGVGVIALGPVAVVNTLRLRVLNPTIAAVDAAAANYRIGVLRPL